MTQAPLIALAAGGTGGHLFPALATARALRQRGFATMLCTDRRGGARLDRTTEEGLAVLRLAAASPSGGAAHLLRAAVVLGLGAARALASFARARPAVVLTFGGYASVPAVAAARVLRIPLVVHEQNRVLGRANRLAAKRAATLALSFEDTRGVPSAFRGVVATTGTPVRAAVADLAQRGYPTPAPDAPLQVLVLGGSQGAAAFDSLLPQALALLPERVRLRLAVVQQVRGDVAVVRAAYRDAGINAELEPFFDDLAARLAVAHLVVARAGASTIAELTIAARPALLIPYPSAADDHQRENALAFAARGGGEVFAEAELTPARLAASLGAWLESPARLSHAADALRTAIAGAPRAEEALADCVQSLVARVPKSAPATGRHAL